MQPPQQHTDQAQNKLLGLELIRFICAISVLFWHYRHFSYIGSRSIDLTPSELPFYPLFAPFYNAGFYGVQVFWCISGFIFFWNYRDAIASGAVSFRKFFILRLSRLYPLHILTLGLVVIFQFIYQSQFNTQFVFQNHDLKHFLLQLILAGAWGFESGDSFNGPTWSISLEVLVYGLFFATLRTLGKSIWVTVAMLMVCAMLRALHVQHTVVNCAAFFYVGGLSAHFAMAAKTSARSAIDSLTGIGCILTPLAAYWLHMENIRNGTALFLMVYTPLVLYSLSRFTPPRKIHAFIESLGNLTYASYLVHFPLQIGIMVMFHAMGIEVPYRDPVFAGTFFIGVLLLSRVIFLSFELPAQAALRRRWL